MSTTTVLRATILMTLLVTMTFFSACSGTHNSPSNDNEECGDRCPALATCADNIRNQDETGIDCGGVCGGNCCDNGFWDSNLGETDVDCGGTSCAACQPSCHDEIMNQNEDGIDCGGACDPCYVGTTYYVSSSGGRDSNDGLTPQTAWQTLGHVGDQPFTPGDAVLLKRGDVWRETFSVRTSGTQTAWITFSAYGSGDMPRILGSTQATDWSEVATHIWQSSTNVSNPYAGGYSYGEVYFEETNGTYSWGRQRAYDASFSNMTREHDWSWNANRVYVYATSNPDTRYHSVEVPQRDSCIRFPNIGDYNVNDEDYVHYVAFDNLEVMYGRTHGFDPGYNEIEAHGLRITNCHIGYIGVKGGSAAYCIAAWHSDALIQNNEIHDCGRRGVSYNTYTNHTPGLTISNVVIDHNHFSHGFHTTGPDISTLPGMGHTFTNIIISNNVIDDTGIIELEHTSNSLYVEANDNNTYSNFHIFNNVIINSTARAMLLVDIDGIHLYHNSVYGSHPDANPYSLLSLNYDQNIDMRNNIIQSTLPISVFEARCVLTEHGTTFLTRDYNLYWVDDASQPFSGSDPTGTEGWDNFVSQWSAWKTKTGFDVHSPAPADPLFIGPTNADVHLDTNSDAIGTGIPIAEVSIDIEGNPRDAAHPCLGAVEE